MASRKIKTKLISVPPSKLIYHAIAVLRPGGRYMPVGVMINKAEAGHDDENPYIVDGEIVFDVATHMITSSGSYLKWYTEFALKDVLIPAAAVNDRSKPHAIAVLPSGSLLYLDVRNDKKHSWIANGTSKTRASFDFHTKLLAACRTYAATIDPLEIPVLFKNKIGCDFGEFAGVETFLRRTQTDDKEKEVMIKFDEETTMVCPTPAPVKRRADFAWDIATPHHDKKLRSPSPLPKEEEIPDKEIIESDLE